MEKVFKNLRFTIYDLRFTIYDLRFTIYDLRFTSFAFCFLLSAFCLLPNELFAKNIKGNGKLVTTSIPVSNFSKIEIKANVDINYSQEKNMGSVEFIIDNNLLEYYDIYTNDDVLYIKYTEKFVKMPHSLKPTKSMMTISSEQLQNIEICGGSIFNFCTAFTSNELTLGMSGSSKVLANKHPVHIADGKIRIRGSGNAQFSGEVQQVDIEIAGSGQVTVLDCKMTKLTCRIRGSGNVQLSGTAEQADLEISGSGQVKALDCTIAKLNALIRGSGNMKASITDMLNITMSGSGKMKYKGNPSILNVVGPGKVVKL